VPVILADTAGLRETADAIESEGVHRALARAEKADLKLLVYDGKTWPSLDEATLRLMDGDAIAVVNKADLIGQLGAGGWGKSVMPATSHQPPQPHFISVKTGTGIPELLDRLIAAADIQVSGASPITRARHRQALEECMRHLQGAQHAAETALRAEDVRLAMRALGRITGRVDVEDLLDMIFRDFCIGK
jgi:tRNA modification GTPase